MQQLVSRRSATPTTRLTRPISTPYLLPKAGAAGVFEVARHGSRRFTRRLGWRDFVPKQVTGDVPRHTPSLREACSSKLRLPSMATSPLSQHVHLITHPPLHASTSSPQLTPTSTVLRSPPTSSRIHLITATYPDLKPLYVRRQLPTATSPLSSPGIHLIPDSNGSPSLTLPFATNLRLPLGRASTSSPRATLPQAAVR